VRTVGSNVSSVAAGDHVVLSYNSCTACRSCQEEKPYQCKHAQSMNFGGSRRDGSSTIINTPESVSTSFFGQSSFCNPAIAQEASCVKIDKKLPLSVVCALGCGFQTGTGAIYNVVKPLERKARQVLIFGIGGVGCAAIMAALQLATSSGVPFEIIAADVNESRLQLARDLGATHAFNSGSESPPDTIMRLTDNEGVDAVIDCTGVPSVINEMMGLVRPGGIAVTVGGPKPGTKAAFDVFDMLIKCKTYSGCHQGNAYSKMVSRPSVLMGDDG
jgi:aryl-alcohol dehydrogenase